MLSPGDRIWVNVPGRGYVGVGTVKGQFVRARDFTVDVSGESRRFLDVAKAAYLRDFAEDEDKIHEHAAKSGFPASKVTEVGKIIDPTTEAYCNV